MEREYLNVSHERREIGQMASLVGSGNVSGDGVSFNHYIIVALWI